MIQHVGVQKYTTNAMMWMVLVNNVQRLIKTVCLSIVAGMDARKQRPINAMIKPESVSNAGQETQAACKKKSAIQSVEIHHPYNINATIQQELVINVQRANLVVNPKEIAKTIAKHQLHINATIKQESV